MTIPYRHRVALCIGQFMAGHTFIQLIQYQVFYFQSQNIVLKLTLETLTKYESTREDFVW